MVVSRSWVLHKNDEYLFVFEKSFLDLVGDHSYDSLGCGDKLQSRLILIQPEMPSTPNQSCSSTNVTKLNFKLGRQSWDAVLPLEGRIPQPWDDLQHGGQSCNGCRNLRHPCRFSNDRATDESFEPNGLHGSCGQKESTYVCGRKACESRTWGKRLQSQRPIHRKHKVVYFPWVIFERFAQNSISQKCQNSIWKCATSVKSF